MVTNVDELRNTVNFLVQNSVNSKGIRIELN